MEPRSERSRKKGKVACVFTEDIQVPLQKWIRKNEEREKFGAGKPFFSDTGRTTQKFVQPCGGNKMKGLEGSAVLSA